MRIPTPVRRDLLELFTYYVGDDSIQARQARSSGICSVTATLCSKRNKDGVTLGTCSVHDIHPERATIICPIRFYIDNFRYFRAVAEDAFNIDASTSVLQLSEYLRDPRDAVVLLGRGSGSEVQILLPDDTKMSYDWILAHIEGGDVRSICGLEIQSVNITQNYRDAWTAHMNRSESPGGKHGLNQANVYKRLISQLVPKGKALSNSHLCSSGLYFVIPSSIVDYFVRKLGNVLAETTPRAPDTLSIFGFEPDLNSYTPGIQLPLRPTVIRRGNIDAIAAMTLRGVGSQGPKIDQAVRQRLKIETQRGN